MEKRVIVVAKNLEQFRQYSNYLPKVSINHSKASFVSEGVVYEYAKAGEAENNYRLAGLDVNTPVQVLDMPISKIGVEITSRFRNIQVITQGDLINAR